MRKVKLITATEVVKLAFGGSQRVRTEEISDAIIISAQQKFITPVIGDLFEAICNGRYSDLLENYIKEPLALYIKYLLIPNFTTQVGMVGVVQHFGEGYKGADTKSLRRLLKSVKSDAQILLDTAIELIEANPTDYPEYEKQNNVRNRVKIGGQIVL